MGFWDDVRKQFADTREARMRGWTSARFQHRRRPRPICEGQGMRTIEMNFLPDVKVPCDACNGARFNQDTLSVQMRGKNAGELLSMEVDDAIGYFAAHPKIHRPLQLMQDVGLGYLTLGQPRPRCPAVRRSASLVTELSKARLTDGLIKTGRASRIPHTLYVLDEPTVGLSMADVEKLIHVLHRLVEAGNTVVVIEHNLDVIAEADWLLDLGPEGGTGGGQLVAQGSPEHVMTLKDKSHTGRVLTEFLAHQHRQACFVALKTGWPAAPWWLDGLRRRIEARAAAEVGPAPRPSRPSAARPLGRADAGLRAGRMAAARGRAGRARRPLDAAGRRRPATLRALVFDGKTDEAPWDSPGPDTPAATLTPAAPRMAEADYLRRIDEIRDLIGAGELYQVNYTQPLDRALAGDPPRCTAASPRASGGARRLHPGRRAQRAVLRPNCSSGATASA